MSKRSKSSTSARPKKISPRKQPLHVFYGGAHLFKAGTIEKLSGLALRTFDERIPHPLALAEVFRLSGPLAEKIRPRIRSKIEKQAIEDYRIDFEDGLGARSEEEELQEAARTAAELAAYLRSAQSPCATGIRIKSLQKETSARALRTLRKFLTTLQKELGGKPPFPKPFSVTLPKVTEPSQVARLSRELLSIERAIRIEKGSLRIEVMLETPSLLTKLGASVRAGGARVTGLHLGPYDYLATCGVAAPSQRLSHPACVYARCAAQAELSGLGLDLVDGATHRMPIGDSPEVLSAWRESYSDIRAALDMGWWQGWDLHPAQTIPRWAAVFAYFAEFAPSACARLKRYLDQASRAGRTGSYFDDAASAQAVHRLLARGLSCGAILPEELAAEELDPIRLQSESFQELARTTAGSGEALPG